MGEHPHDANGTAHDAGDRAETTGDQDNLLVQRWTETVRALDAVQASFAVTLERIGLTLPYFQVLTVLFAAEDQRLPMSRIARDLAMTSGGFTKLADRMARDGLIDRRGSAGDRRVVFAALTDAGHDQAQRAVDAYRAFLHDRVLQVITPEELESMAALVGRLDRIRREREPDGGAFEISPRTPDAPDRRSGQDH